MSVVGSETFSAGAEAVAIGRLASSDKTPLAELWSPPGGATTSQDVELDTVGTGVGVAAASSSSASLMTVGDHVLDFAGEEVEEDPVARGPRWP